RRFGGRLADRRHRAHGHTQPQGVVVAGRDEQLLRVARPVLDADGDELAGEQYEPAVQGGGVEGGAGRVARGGGQRGGRGVVRRVGDGEDGVAELEPGGLGFDLQRRRARGRPRPAEAQGHLLAGQRLEALAQLEEVGGAQGGGGRQVFQLAGLVRVG